MQAAPAKSGPSIWATYSWTFPGAPIRINILLSLVSRLRAELDQHEVLGNGEAGGVLFGYQKNQSTIEIDDYLWVSSKEVSADKYRLDASRLERLRSDYASRDANAGRQPQVVGYFRTQADGSFRLRSEEIEFVQKHFSNPTDVVLLIRTGSRPRTAGYFFWMASGTLSPVSLKDFAFDAELLRQPAPSRSADSFAEPLDSDSVEEVASEPPPPPSPPVPAHEDKIPRNDTGPFEPPIPVWPDPRPDPDEDLFAPRKLAFPAALVAIVGLIALAAFLPRNSGQPAQAVPAENTQVAADKPPLRLEVQEEGNGLDVRWNPESPAATQAVKANLVILEGDRTPRIVAVEPKQLASGHIYYRSSAERIQFELEMVDKLGRVTNESVLALSSKPRTSASVATPQKREAQSPPQTTESVPRSNTQTGAPRRGKNAETPSQAPPSRRAFVPPPSGEARSAVMPAIALDQLPSVAGEASLPASAGMPARLNNPPAPPAPPVNERPTKQIRLSGSLQAANLVRRVAPVYPQAARSAGVQGSVRFNALIGKDGIVRNLQVISGNPVLVQAATDAAKQWLYRPTYLNGEPVEVLTQIDVPFTLDR